MNLRMEVVVVIIKITRTMMQNWHYLLHLLPFVYVLLQSVQSFLSSTKCEREEEIIIYQLVQEILIVNMDEASLNQSKGDQEAKVVKVNNKDYWLQQTRDQLFQWLVRRVSTLSRVNCPAVSKAELQKVFTMIII